MANQSRNNRKNASWTAQAMGEAMGRMGAFQ